MEATPILDHAQVGKMYVTSVSFSWHEADKSYDSTTGKYVDHPGHWQIKATLSDKPSQRNYGPSQTMTLQVEQGIGQKLAECLLPVIIADASRKAQQLADDSKLMLAALGERALTCIADMPAES